MRLMISAAIVLITFGLPAHADAAIKRFDIPAQRAPAALNEFARQADVTLVFSYEYVAQARTNEVRGEYAVIDALNRLIAGTTLAFQELGEGTIAIANGSQVSSASTESVRPEGTGAAQPKGPSNDPSQRVEVEEVVVTGTRFSDRTPRNSPVPVDVVSSEDLRAGGRTELAESLAAVVPALNFTVVSAAGTANATRPFTYRGLPPNEVLVLVNGKRWHPTSPKGLSGGVTFDFNSIPPTAVGSVEVLRDGAAAQYGSDAIAGVINIRLREDLRTEFTAGTSQYYEGDGFTAEAAFDTGMAIGDGGLFHLSTYFRDSDSTNRQGVDKRQQYFAFNASGNPVVLGTASPTDQTPVLPPGFSFDPRELTAVDRGDNFNEGNPERREAGLSFNAQLPLSEQLTVYGFGGYTYRTVETVFTWRRPLDSQNVRAIHSDGYAPVFDARVSDAQLAAGIKGNAGAWDWDLSESWGFNRLASYVENSVNVSLGASSPTSFFSGVQRSEQATTNLDLRREFAIGLNAPLRVALGSEYRHEGFEVRAGEPASYINGGVPVLDGPSAGTLTVAGAQGVVGYAPADVVDASRNSIAGYVDFENEITDKLLLTLAGRYERYSDFGSTANGKFSFRQEFAPWLAVRGSASTGFRAPNLYESHFSSTGSAINSGQFFISRHFPVADPVAQALGARPLEPEESQNYSLGLVLTCNDRLSFSADVYRILVDDTIIQSSNFNDVATRNFLAARGLTGISQATFFTNAVDKRVDGLDFTGNYATTLPGGSTLALSAGANFNEPQVLSVDPTPPELAAVTAIPLFNQRAIVAAEEGAPRSRINAAATWSYGGLQALLRVTRYGSTRELGGSPASTNQVFDAKWITDLEFSYELTDALRLTAGAQNLFDVYPEQNIAATNPGGWLNYPFNFGNAPFGINGGQYYLRALLRL